MPFSVKPNKKLTIEDIRKVMSNHYEGTPNDQTVNGDPHRTSTRTICTASTQNLIVIQGRQFMPTFVGLSLIHISEPTRLGMISYAVFCLKKKKKKEKH